MSRPVSQAELKRKNVVPKGCAVAAVRLSGGQAPFAELSLRCSDPALQPGGPDVMFVGLRKVSATNDPWPEGQSRGTHPSLRLRGVIGVRLPQAGAHVYGAGPTEGPTNSIGFTLSPRAAYCYRDWHDLVCEVK